MAQRKCPGINFQRTTCPTKRLRKIGSEKNVPKNMAYKKQLSKNSTDNIVCKNIYKKKMIC